MFFKKELTEKITAHTSLPTVAAEIVNEYYVELPLILYCYQFYGLYKETPIATRDRVFTKLLKTHLASIIENSTHGDPLSAFSRYDKFLDVTVKVVNDKLSICIDIAMSDIAMSSGHKNYELYICKDQVEFIEILSIMGVNGITDSIKSVIHFRGEELVNWPGKDVYTPPELAIREQLEPKGLLTSLGKILNLGGKTISQKDLPVVVPSVLEIKQGKPTEQAIFASLAKVELKFRPEFNQLTKEQRLGLFASCYSVFNAVISQRPALLDEMNYVLQQQDRYNSFKIKDRAIVASVSENHILFKITMRENYVDLLESRSLRSVTFQKGQLVSLSDSCTLNLYFGFEAELNIISILFDVLVESFGDKLIIAAEIVGTPSQSENQASEAEIVGTPSQSEDQAPEAEIVGTPYQSENQAPEEEPSFCIHL